MSPQSLSRLLTLFILTAALGNINAAEMLSLPTPPRGIQTLGVEVSEIHQDYKRYGLDEAALAEHVAQQLKKAGFKIVPVEEIGDSPDTALLRVKLDLVRSYLGYSYALSVKLIQKIQLAGLHGPLTPVSTWSTGGNGFLRSGTLPRLQNYIADAVKEFIRATKEANH
ncbi:hypothetical protein [Nitrosococcus oceani]|uniref:Uncharacterized protein n=2 Tax=Nitrosococcus oceani TaxID=1229 RepID=Q3J8W0_NITOC|nr:hypothetical protein [Nitrosococcus oceani]KFI18815.1 hypothetical protein IB75_12180 [Nitrosococcus oceani C-27]ABA58736.1 hypothetical protein Noc_2278 [Nitrosococcus oceani ATCC 19707]EDZ68164.1 hypothetical protein NOC27_1491 [Nitrosococcus oceani AFC27]KFI22038.1 hypothetical protein HW44_11655 [Nitrosococcus oceani]GEM19172.1 hypothetical protein NONS58_05470 [Nitrosococcus oceani]